MSFLTKKHKRNNKNEKYFLVAGIGMPLVPNKCLHLFGMSRG
jgi:hypothetical protein